MAKTTPDHHGAELLIQVDELRGEALTDDRIKARVAKMAAARG